MGWDPKTNLQSQNATKAAQRAATENLEEELTQYDSLAFPAILFFNLASTASSSKESYRVAGSTSPRMGKSNWLATSSRVRVSSPQEKKKVWVMAHHRRTKWRGCRGPGSWISSEMKRWPSKHRLAVTTP